ncbi:MULTISPECIES: ABC transporter permease [unclassified Mesorhizobium]|uniref:ABC transporter permease n=1 Tax=unclassified Mesorhizobium TaxID=325217 RepID=UPI000FC9D82B|nr:MULTISPECIES: ABC transporter permease [unclassified Mesorhizobium]TGT53731.1 ABC transporter permease [Mesorhizobium sp. M00.F.Ca.ET.170.01.1.1]RUX52603.1 ABC transporter permease [Mesorhizobium sp. M4A.F.Ca.ET.050.02.1.1]RWB73284.1 MAG: ABC transporter permease [Mesorhizobium sp.]RWB90796.1 MAG: ABC transporter permease [Mesorhizobium sp.]RWC17134.1 MAG: ABC transporter permease [Mesorhizobium sp.]
MLLRLVVWIILAFLLAPLVIIVLFSFHASPALSFPFAGFSLRWYHDLFGNQLLIEAVLKSLTVAALTALITLLLGASASLAWLRFGQAGRFLIEAFTITPIALPGLFVGVSLLVLFAQAGIQLSTATIVISHVVIAIPILVVAMRARLSLFDPSLEEAARDLGASSLQTFARVTLPLMAPTLISSAILAFAVSFDEFVVTSFVAGTETTLPMYIWSMMRRTVTPLINAVSTLALAFSIAILIAAWAIGQLRRNSSIAGRTIP